MLGAATAGEVTDSGVRLGKNKKLIVSVLFQIGKITLIGMKW